MNRLDVPAYMEEVDRVCGIDLPWGELAGKAVVVSGATGMIGAHLIDVLMRKNVRDGLGCRVLALGRSESRARKRLPYFGNPLFSFDELDVAVPGAAPSAPANYVLHLASPTHPAAYAADPIGTVRSNVGGLSNLLDYAAGCGARLLLASSVEVYGQNRGDTELFDESYCGYIECNDVRACYTESKRLCEAMCRGWGAQRSVDSVTARIARVYGPTLLPSDTKALSQFIHRALAGEDIVLKSEGTQRYSYLHVSDVVSGVLSVLLRGVGGEAYNLADPASDVCLRDLAQLVASEAGVGVRFDLPDAAEVAGYSRATVALMDASKARGLGWSASYGIEGGVRETLAILKEVE